MSISRGAKLDDRSGPSRSIELNNRELNVTQVLEHYDTWTRRGRPQLSADEDTVAQYLFDEHAGDVIHSKSGPGTDLYIPKKYTVLGQILLEDPWSEFKRSQDYSGAIVKNIIGFIPRSEEHTSELQ